MRLSRTRTAPHRPQELRITVARNRTKSFGPAASAPAALAAAHLDSACPVDPAPPHPPYIAPPLPRSRRRQCTHPARLCLCALSAYGHAYPPRAHDPRADKMSVRKMQHTPRARARSRVAPPDQTLPAKGGAPTRAAIACAVGRRESTDGRRKRHRRQRLPIRHRPLHHPHDSSPHHVGQPLPGPHHKLQVHRQRLRHCALVVLWAP